MFIKELFTQPSTAIYHICVKAGGVCFFKGRSVTPMSNLSETYPTKFVIKMSHKICQTQQGEISKASIMQKELYLSE